MGAGLLPAVQEVPAGGSAQERPRAAGRRQGHRRTAQGTAAVSVVPHERRRPGRAGQDARGRAGHPRPLHVLHRHEERVEAEVQEQVRPVLHQTSLSSIRVFFEKNYRKEARAVTTSLD